MNLRRRRRLQRRLNVQITISTRPTGLTNLPPGVFEFKSTGLYKTRICRRGRHNACPEGGNYRTAVSSDLADGFQAFPNPFEDYLELRINASESEQPQIKLMDMQGKHLPLEASLKFMGDEQWIASFSTQDLPPGMYMLQLLSGEYPEVIKLLKK